MQDASSNLGLLFQEKMVKIKARISDYFGKTDLEFDRISKEIYEISQLIKRLQDVGQTPTNKYDAQLFALKELVEQGERDREAS